MYLTLRLAARPLPELDGGDLPLGGVGLDLGLQRLPHHARRDVRVLDVAGRREPINIYKSNCSSSTGPR